MRINSTEWKAVANRTGEKKVEKKTNKKLELIRLWQRGDQLEWTENKTLNRFELDMHKQKIRMPLKKVVLN